MIRKLGRYSKKKKKSVQKGGWYHGTDKDTESEAEATASENCGITDPPRSVTGEYSIIVASVVLLGKDSKKRACGFSFRWEVRVKEYQERNHSQQMVKKMA